MTGSARQLVELVRAAGCRWDGGEWGRGNGGCVACVCVCVCVCVGGLGSWWSWCGREDAGDVCKCVGVSFLNTRDTPLHLCTHCTSVSVCVCVCVGVGAGGVPVMWWTCSEGP